MHNLEFVCKLYVHRTGRTTWRIIRRSVPSVARFGSLESLQREDGQQQISRSFGGSSSRATSAEASHVGAFICSRLQGRKPLPAPPVLSIKVDRVMVLSVHEETVSGAQGSAPSPPSPGPAAARAFWDMDAYEDPQPDEPPSQPGQPPSRLDNDGQILTEGARYESFDWSFALSGDVSVDIDSGNLAIGFGDYTSLGSYSGSETGSETDSDIISTGATPADHPAWVARVALKRPAIAAPELICASLDHSTAATIPTVTPPQHTVPHPQPLNQREVLEGLSLRALMSLAETAGVGDSELDAVEGKNTLIELIMATGLPIVDGGGGSTPAHRQHVTCFQVVGAAVVDVKGPSLPSATALPLQVSDCCPFCSVPWATAMLPLPSPHQEDQKHKAQTLKARKRREVKGIRRENRKSKWWSKVGYQGPAYCRRCSETFRDHIIRSNSNSAKCSRQDPCGDCAKILAYFPELEASYVKMDSKREVRKNADEPSKQNKKARLLAATAVIALSAGVVCTIAATSDTSTFAKDPTAIFTSCQPQPVGENLGAIASQPQYSGCAIGTTCNYTCGAGFEPAGTVFCRPDGSIDGVIKCNGCDAPHTTSPLGTGCTRCTKCGPGADVVSECTSTADTICGSWDSVSLPTLRMAPRHSAASWTDQQNVGWIFGGLGARPFSTSAQAKATDAAAIDYTLATFCASMRSLDHSDQVYRHCDGKCQPEADCSHPSPIRPYEETDSSGFRSDMWKLLRSPSNATFRAVRHERKTGASWPAHRSHAASWANDETGHGFVFGGQRVSPVHNADIRSLGKRLETVTMSDLWVFNGSTWTFLGGDIESDCGFINEIAFEKAAFDYKYQPGRQSDGQAVDSGAESPSWPLARVFGSAAAIRGTSSAFFFGGLLAIIVPPSDTLPNGVPPSAACGDCGVTYVPLNDLWVLDGESEFWSSLQAGRHKYSTHASVNLKNSKYASFAVANGRFAPWISVEQPGLPFNAPSTAKWPGGRAGHAMWTDSTGQLYVFGGIGPLDMPSRIDEAANNPDAFNIEERLPGYCHNSQELWRFGPSSQSPGDGSDGSVHITTAGLLDRQWTKMSVVTRSPSSSHLYTELFGGASPLRDGFYSNAAPCAKLVEPGCEAELGDIGRGTKDGSLLPERSLHPQWTPGAGASVWSKGSTVWGIGGAVLRGAVSNETVPGSWAPTATADESTSALYASLWSLESAEDIFRGRSVNLTKSANGNGKAEPVTVEDVMVLRVESQESTTLPPARFGSSILTMASDSVAVLGGQCKAERAVGWGWGDTDATIVVAGMDCDQSTEWIGTGTSLTSCAIACAGYNYFVRTDGTDKNCKCCTSLPDTGPLTRRTGFNVWANGDSPAKRDSPEIVIPRMDCQSAGPWIGAGTNLEKCAAMCSDYDYFSRVDGGDGNCKCCVMALDANVLNAESEVGQRSNVYRTAYGLHAPDSRGQPPCHSAAMWIRSSTGAADAYDK